MIEDVNSPASPPQPPPEAAYSAYPTLEDLAALLPQYEMHEVIGVGGMGAVYKGRQTALDRWVAIKVLPAVASQNLEDTQRFIKEARAMARLVHPHIVAVFDFGQTYAGHLYLVMEYVEGSDLHRRTRAQEVTPQRAREVIAQLCDALQFAHDHGVAHRDIKPANILITHDWKVKVADFGLARDLTAQPNSDEPEYGTPDYTAPERLIVGAVVDHRADIYSLGVVIHEMLTGKTPTAAGANASKGLPEGFAGVISKCLMREPERRYQMAREVKTALLTATAEKGRDTEDRSAAYTPAPKPMTRYRPSLFAAFWRALGPVGWGIASMLLLGGFGWLIFRDKLPQQTVAEMAPAVPPQTESSDLVVIAPPLPKPVEPPPMQEPAPEPPKPAPAQPNIEKPKVAVEAVITLPQVPLDQPYTMPDGAPGEVARLKGHTAPVYNAWLMSDQRRVVTASYDSTLRVWDLLGMHELLRVDPGIGEIDRLIVSADEKRALISSMDTDRLAILDLATGKTTATATAPGKQLNRPAFILNEKQVLGLTADDEGGVFRWDLASGTMETVPGWEGRANYAHLFPGGDDIFIVGHKTSPENPNQRIPHAAVLSLSSGKITPHDRALPGFITFMTVSPDSRLAVAVGSGMDIFEWPSMQATRSIPLDAKGPRPWWKVCFLDKSRLILTGWSDRSLRVHELETGREVYHTTTPNRMTDICVSRDERWAVAATSYTSKNSMQPGDFDLILWRLPKPATLVSEEMLDKQALEQVADLPTHDTELARLRAELLQAAQLPSPAEKAAQMQTLNTQYIAAVRREAQRMPPTEQKVLLAEVDMLALGATLPPPGMDTSVPAALQKLRAIYRGQLAALEDRQKQAAASAVRAIESRLIPLRQQREGAGDRLGAKRADLVLKSLLPADTTSAPSAPPTSTDASPPPPISAGTPVKRPDRPGSVIAIARVVKNTTPPFAPPAVSRIPADLKGVVAITGGRDHVFALLQDGRVRGWGTWQGVDVGVADSATDIVRLDSTDSTALALRADGRVIAWGPTTVANPTVWEPSNNKAAADICAGLDVTGYVLCTDGTLLPITGKETTPPATLAAVMRLFHVPNGGCCAIQRDGIPVFWGTDIPPVTPLPSDLRDLAYLSFSPRYAVAMKKDGTLEGWGEIAPDQRFRIRKFTGSIAVLHDSADRVFPVHRGDHSWELVPNPNVSDYVSEDRSAVIEGRLRGCLDAVFAEHHVLGLRPQ